MSEKQHTLEGKLVPVAPHRDDIVECSDGTVCTRHEACFDVRGCAHRTEEGRHEANVEIVREILKGVEEWSEEYHTGNGDYPDCYYFIVNETSHEWPDSIERWIRTNGDRMGHTKYDDCMDKLVEHICMELDGSDCEAEYSRNEYSSYSGAGCCLFSLGIGEIEEQIDISYYPELKELHDLRELDDCLDELKRDFCIHRSRRRVQNEETGRYEYVGRETYMPFENSTNYFCFSLFTMPGGQWHFVVPADRINDLICEFWEKYNK